MSNKKYSLEPMMRMIDRKFPIIESKKKFEKQLMNNNISIDKNLVEMHDITKIHALTQRDWGVCVFVWLRTSTTIDAIKMIYKYF